MDPMFLGVVPMILIPFLKFNSFFYKPESTNAAVGSVVVSTVWASFK